MTIERDHVKITITDEGDYFYAQARHHTKRGQTARHAADLLINEMMQAGTITPATKITEVSK